MRRLAGTAALLTCVITLAGCGGTSSDAGPTKTVTVTATPTYLGDPTEAATATPSDDADEFAPNVGDRALQVGQPRVGSALTTVLLSTKLDFPPADYLDPEPGKQWMGFRVSQCLRKDYSDGDPIYSSYPGEWFAVAPDGNQYTGSDSYTDWPSPKFPEQVSLNPGDCVKGFMALQLPAAIQKLSKLVWRPGGETTAEWLTK